ncbi:MAG: gliding motility-associated C-terminal domain-containing protein [Bacteroidales bacterium]|nr:gliding motility-associated C-terminal domain-containing protein [Bacteroidales bacterium]MDD3665716.1 gliding motility-associated C-terminal domain-containing protein [Bacteroidales bacterium]
MVAKHKITFLGLFALFFSGMLTAGGRVGEFAFIENKGQWPSQVLYTANPAPNVTLFVEHDGLKFNITDPNSVGHSHAHHGDQQQAHSPVEKGHAYKMVFDRFNKGTSLTAEGQAPDYLNFFLSDRAVSGVRKYHSIRFNNLYPGIDLLLTSKNGNLKLEWQLQRGADPRSIRIRYDGIDNFTIRDGQLSIQTTVGEVNEGYPDSWVVHGTDKTTLSCDYSKYGLSVGFALSSIPIVYDTLVIDPELIFSTYSGSTVDNWGFTATYDHLGNVFSGGIASGAGYPVTVGAWQQTYAGGWDVAIIKYDSTGTLRRWATYLGGNKADIPHSIICDEAGNLYIMGTTGSANFPMTAGAYDPTFNGGTPLTYDDVLQYPQGVDLFVAKLSADGTQLLASTFLGGTGNDGLNFRSRYDPVNLTGNDTLYYNYGDGARGEISIDGQNYVYIGSCTFSTNYPVTADAVQPQNNGKQEGVVSKLSPTLSSLTWSTYMGGSGDDAIYSIDVNTSGVLFATGGTTSTNIGTTPGAWKTTFQGGSCDGFLLKLSANGQQKLGLTYFGSNKYDQAYFVRADRLGNPHLFGQTKAAGNTLVYNATYSVPGSGQFLAKFNASLTSLIWSSVFGSGRNSPDISPTAFSVDVCNRIYVSGWGREWGGQTASWGSQFGTKGMPITPDAWQNQTDGQDFYIGVFGENMDGLDYATYFGEIHYAGCNYSGHDHVDGGTSRFDRNGNIYQSVCASCGACQQFPTFPNPGAWSNSNNSSNCNNAVFKIRLITDYALAAFNPVSPGCSPYAVQFQNTGRGTQWLWNFGDPASGSANTSTLKNPQHTFQQAGNYTVRLIARWPQSCNIADTLYRSVSVLSDTVYQLDTITTCNGQPVQIGIPPSPDPSITYAWSPSSGLNDPNVSNPTAKPATSTLYLLVTGNGICTDSIYQMVMVDQVWLETPGDTVVCDTTALLSAQVSPSSSLLWSSQPDFSDTLNVYPSGNAITVNGQGTFHFWLKAVSEFGCIVIDSLTLQLSKPDVSIAGPALVCQGDSVWFHVIQPEAGMEYQWKSSAMMITGQGTDSLLVRPFTGGYVAVRATDTLTGCSDTAIVFFEVESFVIRLQTIPTTCFDTCDGEASLMITGGTPPYLVRWSNGQMGFSANELCSGSQWVRVVDSKGCDSLFLFEMPSPPEILTNDTSAGVSCYGYTDGFITLQTTGGVPPYTWLWSNGANTESLSDLLPGTYTVMITDASGCRKSKTWILTEPQPVSITAQVIQVACHGDSTGVIKLLPAGGTPPFNALWSNGMTGLTIESLPAGAYQAVVTDNEGCQMAFDTLVNEPDQPLAVTAHVTPPRCFYSADGAVNVDVSGGVLPYSGVWSNGTTGFSLVNVAGGAYTLTLSDGAGCVENHDVVVPVPDSMQIEATVVHPTCATGPANGWVNLVVTAAAQPVSVAWNNGQTGTYISGLPEGTYQASVTDSNGCRQYRSYHLVAPPALMVTPLLVEPTCFEYSDGSLLARASGGIAPYSYLWSTGSTSDEIFHLPSGIYTLQLTDSLRCRKDTAIFLPQPTQVTFEKEVVLPECRGASNGSVLLKPSGGTPPYQATWNDGIVTLLHTDLRAGEYVFTLSDTNSCTLSDTVVVREQDCELEIPNVITPNGDGFNDYFTIPNIHYYPDNELFIYSRWGNEVRHYNSYKGEWDGRDQGGNPVSEGTYYYILVLRNIKQYQGVITVLR